MTARGPEPPAQPRVTRSVERLRLALLALCLGLLVLAQSAGNASTDTKIDLVVSPLRFLSRSLRLWDPVGAAGQLQNQAYGYLFPMGPFFALTHAVGLAPWEMQRLWEAGLVVAAFLGTYLLSRRLGVEGFWPPVGAGLVYALAPRMLSELTSISSELMPVAALPWVLLPLVAGAREGSPRRAAALSGIALLFAGGVNAAATLAILPVPAAWLLTRERGPRRRALIGWWVGAVLMACAWWLIPLALLGKYSPPFLDWIESSSTTTLPTSLLATLRGVDHWESYLGPNIWPAGWIFASAPATILATAAVAGAGLAGLGRRRLPHRLFLWLTLLLGLTLVTAGHSATVGPPGAGAVRSWLDGPLVAFRNLHKFDPLIRLPLAIGVGHLLARTPLPRRAWVRVSTWRVRLPVRALAAAAVAAVGLVAVSPALTNHLVSSQRITTEPGWWRQAASWLAHNSHGARALVVPGSASPVYVWGGTVDNALQPVATTPWTTRDSVPLTQAGYIRLLDSVEQILASGASHPELAPLLARAGIGYIVLANDLDAYKSVATRQVFVRATLEDSPGFSAGAQFGPLLGGSTSSANLLDGGTGVPRPAISIYQVAGWTGMTGLAPLEGAVEATGSSDTLAQLVARGLGPDTPVLFGADAASAQVTDPVEVTTDGIRKREASFGNLLTKSSTMTANEPYSAKRAAHDYLPGNPGDLSVMSYSGIADVTASSAGSDLLAYFNRGPDRGPWSAVDNDPSTYWGSSGLTGALRQWLQIRFDTATSATTARLQFARAFGALPTEIAVRTDAGTIVQAVAPTTRVQDIRVPPGPTRTLRVTVLAVSDHTAGASVGIASLSVPGVTPQRSLLVSSEPDPSVLAFDGTPGYRGQCIEVTAQAICDPSYRLSGEEDAAIERAFTVGSSAAYRLSATVRLKPGPTLNRLLDADGVVHASGSSVDSADPRVRPGAAVDGDPRTTWQAVPGDQPAKLTLRLAQSRDIVGVTLRTPPSAPVATPERVLVTAGKQRWQGLLPADGVIRVPAEAQTRTIEITILSARPRSTTSSVTAATRLLAPGISEATVDTATPLPAATPASSIAIGCDAGIGVEVDGARIALRVLASRTAALTGQPVAATPCDPTPITLTAGRHRVALVGSALAAPTSLTLAKPGASLAPARPSAGTQSIESWGATSRRVRVDTSAPALLVVRENFNSGWQATVGGNKLDAIRVDGWQQAFVIPGGVHGVVALSYAPQRPFTVGLIIGLIAALGVVVLAFVRTPSRQRRDRGGVGEARLGRWTQLGGLAVAVGVLGGFYGLAVLAVALGALALLGRTTRGAPVLISAGLLVLAALSVARTGSYQIFNVANGAMTQLLCLAAVVAAAVGGSTPDRRQGRVP
ncbi:MAG TPA: alpha-(1-_3)-arabinofuranosyltransferase family protein [Jatrophihabitantaceae bacterium]